jgi:hypothetical protein
MEVMVKFGVLFEVWIEFLITFRQSSSSRVMENRQVKE